LRRGRKRRKKRRKGRSEKLLRDIDLKVRRIANRYNKSAFSEISKPTKKLYLNIP
jgi:hypothetical protein